MGTLGQEEAGRESTGWHRQETGVLWLVSWGRKCSRDMEIIVKSGAHYEEEVRKGKKARSPIFDTCLPERLKTKLDIHF